MAPPRPQPLRRGLLTAAELRFQLVELHVDSSLVVLPVAARKLLAGFPLRFTLRVLRRGDLSLDVGTNRRSTVPPTSTWPRRSPRDSARSQPPAMRYARPRRWSRSRPAPTPSRRCRPGRTATRGHSPLAAPISMPSGPPMIAMSRPMRPPPAVLGRNIDSTRSFSTTCPSSPCTTTTASCTRPACASRAP
jgi:hypothetical protein